MAGIGVWELVLIFILVAVGASVALFLLRK
jgi:uncharacterized membrane protein